MTVRSGEHAAQRNYVTIRHALAFEPLFVTVDWRTSGDLTAAWCLGDGAIDGDLIARYEAAEP